jgi:general secretion pathway protein C
MEISAATLGTSAQGPAAFTLQLPVRAPISVGNTGLPSMPAAPSPAARPSGLFPAAVPPVIAPSPADAAAQQSQQPQQVPPPAPAQTAQ